LKKVVVLFLCLSVVLCGCNLFRGSRSGEAVAQPEGADMAMQPEEAPPEVPAEPAPEPAGGEKPLAEGPPPEQPKPSESPEMKRYKDERSLEEDEKKRLSRHYFKAGLKFFKQNDYIRAEYNFKMAVRIDPTFSEALDYLYRTWFILGKREGEFQTIKEWEVWVRRTLIDQKKKEVERDFRAARRLLEEGEYDRAIKLFEICLEQLRWFPYKIEKKRDYERECIRLIADAKRRKADEEIRERERKLELSRRSALAEEKRYATQEQEKIARTLKKAMDMLARGRIKKAIILCDEVLYKDPDNAIAKALKEYAKSLGHAIRISRNVADLEEEKIRFKENVDEAGIPYLEYVVFPDAEEWLNVQCKRYVGITEEVEEESDEVKRMKQKLETFPVTLRFKETALRDVVQFLQDMTGLNIVIDPQVDASVTVDLTIDKLILKNALNLIMKQTELKYIFKENVIYITTAEAAVEKLILEIYNVSDIMATIPNFSGPDIRVLDPEELGPGGAGGPAPIPIGDEEEGEMWGIDELIELIQAATGDDAWAVDGAMIEGHRGQLIVINTREVHKKVRTILEQFRRNFGMFVCMEVRFVAIRDTLLEDVGIDYRGIGNGAQWIPVNPPPPLLPNRTGGTDPGIGRRVPGRGREEWVGRIQNPWLDVFARVIARPITSGLWFQSTWIEPFQLNAIMHARTEQLRLRNLASATVTAHNRQRVYIAVLNQRAYIADYDTSGAGGLAPFEVGDPIIKNFQEGTVLEVQPIISADRKYVTVNVRATYSHLMTPTLSTIIVNMGTIMPSVVGSPIEIPEIGIDRVFTSATIPDGGTVLLGGLRQSFKRKYVSTVPIFGSIPILGWAFRSTGYVRDRQDLVMLLTARIIILREEEKARFGEQAVRPK